MNVAAYLRVSTDDQLEYSPDAQLRAIRDYCVKNGYVLADEHIYIDEGISGRSAAKRPSFQRMILDAKSKEKPFSAIIVHKFDRFARNREDSVVYKSLLRKEYGIKVISMTESIEDDKFSVILEAMLEAMAEYYSLNLAEEVKKGMTEKALRGEPLTIAPFGYKMEDKQLVINPEQAEIIKGIYDKYLVGTTMFKIARELNIAGIRTNRGNKFENRTIEYILCNPVYIGKIRWNPERRTRRNYSDPDIMIVPGTHEAIIDNDTWQKVQDKMALQKEKHKSYSKADSVGSHWLVGVLKCSNCGTGMVRNGKVYLQCRKYVGGVCTVSHNITIENAENAVLSQLLKDIQSSAPLDLAVAGEKAQSLSLIDKQLKALERRLERVKDAYSAGIDTLEEYKANKEKIIADIEKLNAEKAQSSEPQKPTDYAEIRKTLKDGYNKLTDTSLSMEEKKVVAKQIFDRIVYAKAEKTLYIVYNA